jgi:predicted GNAT family N-acyltransferase
MKHLLALFLCATISAYCCDKQIVTIRPAQLNDIEQLTALSLKSYQNDWKPLLQQSYQLLFPDLDIEKFVIDKAKLNNENNEKIINNSDQTKPNRLLVATIQDQESLRETIAGFCRFEQQDEQTMYVNFILVDETLRKQEIGKKLALAAMNTFPNVTTCKFRAQVHYTKINEIYTQHGCVQTGTVALDLSTGAINTDPDAPITHYDYEYTIKR